MIKFGFRRVETGVRIFVLLMQEKERKKRTFYFYYFIFKQTHATQDTLAHTQHSTAIFQTHCFLQKKNSS